MQNLIDSAESEKNTTALRDMAQTSKILDTNHIFSKLIKFTTWLDEMFNPDILSKLFKIYFYQPLF